MEEEILLARTRGSDTLPNLTTFSNPANSEKKSPWMVRELPPWTGEPGGTRAWRTERLYSWKVDE
eukprot:752615-Hanusia_phi.AAC.2